MSTDSQPCTEWTMETERGKALKSIRPRGNQQKMCASHEWDILFHDCAGYRSHMQGFVRFHYRDRRDLLVLVVCQNGKNVVSAIVRFAKQDFPRTRVLLAFFEIFQNI